MAFLSIERDSSAFVVTGFQHFGGQHCETTALRKVLAFTGQHYSEPLLFGLAGGIAFVYWWTKKMPRPFVGGRNGRFPDFIETCARRLGASLDLTRTNRSRKGYENLKDVLRGNQPVVVYGDIAELPYFATQRHFGGHAFVVYGLSESENCVFVSDRCEQPCTVTIQELAKARGASCPPFTPRHSLLRVVRNEAPSDMATSVREAIRDSVKSLRSPPIRKLGLPGIKTFADDLSIWPRRLTPEALPFALTDTFINLELAGTGGGAFRRMYAAFLREAKQWIDAPRLDDAISHVDMAAAHWETVAKAFLPDDVPALRRCRELLVKRNRLFEAQSEDAQASMEDINERLREAMSDAILDSTLSSELLEHAREKVLACYALEGLASSLLAEVCESEAVNQASHEVRP
uniref:Butirosin biosynthesis protein H, N-terminal n=1 Tax=Candidatus Kentrum sp. MB TaxID=2138164 RepID=A0A450XK37_9GAMM|nr:MAG: protein of unknown function (DUF4872) [Candidatus Kentron sp. MB]VFK29626.1 MAG: protein of unknown function (DUF4872) [Candidatus Kentron sp. MB]VFK74841.1 MAG: protein of unknown function (DUF4872) [Candidatus Kentron sp. MB]